MLAGRKLLLADDSITIQKVVALTFADEGVEVLAVSDGADAIEKLEEFRPDVVLADVYMPKMTGLQVCEYIKRSEKLKHIPVMLLVGSFEPFNEAEARRVGAEDTLTKPFQSIRTLVEKVGVLLGREPAPVSPETVSRSVESEPIVVPQAKAELDSASAVDGASTLEFPEPEKAHAPEQIEEVMDSGELELTTADTRPLSPEIRAHVLQPSNEDRVHETAVEKQKMETPIISDAGPELSEGFGDALLDLGDFEAAPLMDSDDVILDIDFPAPEVFHAAPADNRQSALAVEAPAAPRAASEDDVAWKAQREEVVEWQGEIQTNDREWVSPSPVREAAVSDEAAAEWRAAAAHQSTGPALSDSGVTHRPAPTAAFSGQITLDQLSPEAIDAIARRVVEQLSEKVVQEIAWEVVPQLAELLINRKLEESK